MACSAAEPEHARNNDVAAKLQPSPRLSYYGTLGASVSGFQKPSSSCKMALMPAPYTMVTRRPIGGLTKEAAETCA